MFRSFTKNQLTSLIALLLVFSMLIGAAPQAAEAAAAAPVPAPAAQQASDGQAKYVFLFIGDGMGVAQRTAAELYLAALANATPAEANKSKLLMNTFPAQGMTTTYDAGAIITDSASAGTALATGNKTLSGVVSMDVNKTVEYKTIAESARDAGRKVGVISSVSLDHATPAVFYAHRPSRGMMYEIAMDLATSDFDFFAGGAFVQPKGKNGDKSMDVYYIMEHRGYTIVDSLAEFNALKPGDEKIVAINPVLQDSEAMEYEMDRSAGALSLADLTSKGIEVLDNPEGFFMMVEGGKIDWACHANDAAASIHDTLAFDESIAVAYDFYQQHPDETLIVVTGDHETGGMTIGYAGTQYNSFMDKLEEQKESFVAFSAELAAFKEEHGANGKFEDILPMIQEAFGLKVLSADERAAVDEIIAAGSAEGATDEDKKAASEAEKSLSMVLTDLELQVVEQAFKESMNGLEVRAQDEATYLLYGGYEPLTVKLTTILNNKAGIGWTTYSHTGVPVQTSAIGVGSDQFNGYYDNTDIYARMMDISGLKN